MIEVQAPDGKTVEFPDGTSEDVIKNIMRGLADSPEPPTPGPPIPKVTGLKESGLLPGKTPRETGEELKAGVRPAVVAGAATAGGAAGMAGGPAGLVAGAVAGSAAGSLIFDSLNDAMRAFGLEELPGGTPLQDTPEQNLAARSGTALGEAKTEAMFTGGLSTIFPVKRFLTPLMGKVFGVRGDTSKTVRALAASQGIELSAVDVGGPIAKGFAKLLGVFPFTGTPLRKAMVFKEGQVSARMNELLDEIAPTSTVAGEIGIDMAKAAQGANHRFHSIAGALYEPLKAEMRALPVPAIPSRSLKEEVGRIVKEAKLRETPLAPINPDDPIEVIKGSVTPEFEAFLKKIERTPDHLTYDQWRGLQDELKGFVDNVNPNPFNVKRVAQIKQGMEADLNTIGEGIPENVISSDVLDALRLRKQGADAWFANGIVAFQTTTAAKFARANPKMFKAGFDKAGTIDTDELLKPVFNTNSPQALRDLRSLVGDDTFRQAARTHMDDVTARSFKSEVRGGSEVQVFDLDAFQRNLGLASGPKNKSGALEEMLRGTGVKVQDLRDLIENARVHQISDPATFLARRVTLAGAAGLGALLGVGGGMVGASAGGVTLPILAAILSRGGAKVLADPKFLKPLTRAFSPSLSDIERRALTIRIVRQLGTAERDRIFSDQVEPQRDFPVGSPP